MQKNDVRLWKFFPSLLRNSNIQIFMKWGVHEPYLVIIDNFKKLLLSRLEALNIGLLIKILISDLDSAVIFIKLYLIVIVEGVLLYLLKEVLTVKPNHLNGGEVNTYFSNLFICHYNLIIYMINYLLIFIHLNYSI